MRISKKTKSIISGILLVAIIVGVLALAGSILGKDTKTISSTAFAVGGINDQGNYVESKTSIYTKDMFECQGLTIEPDFEATGIYKVFYYGEDKNFIGVTAAMNAEDGVYNKGATFQIAKYARVMITPAVPVDDDGNVVEDFKIRFYEVSGYANDYNITVSKEQTMKYELTALDFASAKNDKVWVTSGSGMSELSSSQHGQIAFDAFELNAKHNYLYLAIFNTSSPATMNFLFTDADGLVVQDVEIGTDWVTSDETGIAYFNIEIPENSVSCYLTSVSTVTSFALYSYK